MIQWIIFITYCCVDYMASENSEGSLNFEDDLVYVPQIKKKLGASDVLHMFKNNGLKASSFQMETEIYIRPTNGNGAAAEDDTSESTHPIYFTGTDPTRLVFPPIVSKSGH